MATVAKTFTKLETLEDKRRKKAAEEAKSLVLPQKKRVLPPNPSSSPVKKSQRLSSSPTGEGTADETLIRETEAALKNLGSWPGARAYGAQNEESPAFENLFDEKKSAVKMSPSSASNSSTDNQCSLKDVITLREDDKTDTFKNKVVRIKQEVIEEGKCGGSSDYRPPDFNEMADDSSNELEIDMSEAASEKNEASTDETDSSIVDRKRDGPGFTPFSRHSGRLQTSPFSTTSAFRPPQPSNKNLGTLGPCQEARTTSKGGDSLCRPPGPFPAEATFVGYPGMDQAASSEDKPKNILKPVEEVAAKSPEAANKQYTILQPANIRSRTSMQDASSRESSSADSSGDKVTVTAPGGSLSPNSIGRGESCAR